MYFQNPIDCFHAMPSGFHKKNESNVGRKHRMRSRQGWQNSRLFSLYVLRYYWYDSNMPMARIISSISYAKQPM